MLDAKVKYKKEHYKSTNSEDILWLIRNDKGSLMALNLKDEKQADTEIARLEGVAYVDGQDD